MMMGENLFCASGLVGGRRQSGCGVSRQSWKQGCSPTIKQIGWQLFCGAMEMVLHGFAGKDKAC